MADEHRKATGEPAAREPAGREHIEATLARVREAIRLRNMQLSTAEYILIQRVLRQHITLLNPVTRKLHVQFMELMNTTLQLDCKMIRRNLFFLRSRERTLENELARLATLDPAEPVDPGESFGLAANEGDAA